MSHAGQYDYGDHCGVNDTAAVNDEGWTALHIAAYEGRVDAAYMLAKELGANVGMVDMYMYGRTPLMIAKGKHCYSPALYTSLAD